MAQILLSFQLASNYINIFILECDYRCSVMLCVDGDGKQASCSSESTPLHADWPPASLVVLPHQFDQSQGAHLSRDPQLSGVDAFLTSEAELSAGPSLPDGRGYSTIKTSFEVLEHRPLSTELSIRHEAVTARLVPDNVLSALSAVEGQTLNSQSQRLASQETVALSSELKSLPTVLGETSASSGCVQPVPLSDDSSQLTQAHRGVEYHHQSCESTTSTQQAVQVVSGSLFQEGRRSDVDVDVESRRLDVVECSTLQPSDSTTPTTDQLITPGT